MKRPTHATDRRHTSGLPGAGFAGLQTPRFGLAGTRCTASPLASCAGMSLIEIMVAVLLLTVIMLGLFSAFYQTQRALKLSTSQTDVLEGGRSTLALLSREIEEVTASEQADGVNLLTYTPPGAVSLPLPGGTNFNSSLEDFFFLTLKNDTWTGKGYFLTVKGEGVGSLYRFAVTNDPTVPTNLVTFYNAYTRAVPGDTNVGRVADGIVHLALHAFDTRGIEYAPGLPYATNNSGNIGVWPGGFGFTNQMLPAFLDLELGMVDVQTYRQFKLLSSNSPALGVNFLQNQAGKVYLFRERIPIRNHHEP